MIFWDTDLRVVDWNPVAERIFGYTPGEAIGQSLTILIPETFRSAHDEGLARVASGGEQRVIGRTVELVGLRRGDVEFPIELSLAMWEQDDGTLGYVLAPDTVDRIPFLSWWGKLRAFYEKRILGDNNEPSRTE